METSLSGAQAIAQHGTHPRAFYVSFETRASEIYGTTLPAGQDVIYTDDTGPIS